MNGFAVRETLTYHTQESDGGAHCDHGPRVDSGHERRERHIECRRDPLPTPRVEGAQCPAERQGDAAERAGGGGGSVLSRITHLFPPTPPRRRISFLKKDVGGVYIRKLRCDIYMRG